MREITVTNLIEDDIPQDSLEELGKNILGKLGREGSISVVIVSVARMSELNQQYRHKSGSTDVLSFDLEPKSDNIFGEVFISNVEAAKLAEDQDKTTEKALQYLLIHGILHLAGYDHENVPAQKTREMFRLQDKLIHEFDVEF